jgi:2-iminobutanoate/2-iminopropanoate deaminase
MKRQIIKVPMVTSPLLSHAVRVGDLVFTSGEVAVDPQSGEAVPGDVKVQTARILDNLKLILATAGTSLDNAVKVTVYLRNWDDFDAFNEVYRTYFPADPPGRTTTQAGRLGRQFLIEIEMIAAMP